MNLETLAENSYYELKEILNKLAHRANPKVSCWFYLDWLDRPKCNICKKKIAGMNFNYLDIRKHGIQHLVDSNLLPFI